jgi:hypothetical protein
MSKRTRVTIALAFDASANNAQRAVNYAEPPDLSNDDVETLEIEQAQNKRRKIDPSAPASALVPLVPKKQRKASKGKKVDETKFEFLKL